MSGGGYNGGSTVIHGGSGWFGHGSVTSQPGNKSKGGLSSAKSRKKAKAKAKKGSPSGPEKGNGLTLAETIAKSVDKVGTIEGEIAKTKLRLAMLEHNLVQAVSEAEVARKLPLKTAKSMALDDTGKAIAPSKPAKSKSTTGTASKAGRAAERKARQNYRNAPKEVVVVHQVAGKIVRTRTVERS